VSIPNDRISGQIRAIPARGTVYAAELNIVNFRFSPRSLVDWSDADEHA
jgi:hypothetical protein